MGKQITLLEMIKECEDEQLKEKEEIPRAKEKEGDKS
jgi:hypothetical protein